MLQTSASFAPESWLILGLVGSLHPLAGLNMLGKALVAE